MRRQPAYVPICKNGGANKDESDENDNPEHAGPRELGICYLLGKKADTNPASLLDFQDPQLSKSLM